jgi:hypothetical protein|tara:strand:- start:887 stop:1432 length:546 start_codon:yes stop_codon:yes gene_type:complete
MNRLSVKTADIIFENYELGKGKIIISDLEFGSWSFYWGSMGSSIEEFIQRINPDYFAGKLCDTEDVFCSKATAKAVRKYIKEELAYDLPWYKFASAQKEMREMIKEIERSYSQEDALHIMTTMHKNLMCYDLDRHDEKEFLGIIEGIFSCEPWHFLQNKRSREYNYLHNLHKLLKVSLAKK